MKNLFLLAFVAISLSFASCGSDVDCNDTAAFEAEIEAEATALFTTGFAYALDPSNSELCSAYEDAINAYIKVIEPYRECSSGADLVEFDNSLEEIKQALDDLDC